MAMKRKATKAPFRRRVRRKVPARKVMPKNMCLTKRFCNKQTITGLDTPSYGLIGYTFSLGDLAAYTDITNMFDMYQIAGIKFRWVLKKNPDISATTAANKGALVRVLWSVDRNDSSSPANFQELQAYAKYREAWLSESHPWTRWQYFKPCTLSVGYTTSVTSNYASDYKRWVATADSGCPYYGLKMAYDQLFAGVSMEFECVYYIKAKTVR